MSMRRQSSPKWKAQSVMRLKDGGERKERAERKGRERRAFRVQNESEMGPKEKPNEAQMGPKWDQGGSKGCVLEQGAKM